MCTHCESIPNLVVLRLKTGSLLRSYYSSNIRVHVFRRLFLPPHPSPPHPHFGCSQSLRVPQGPNAAAGRSGSRGICGGTLQALCGSPYPSPTRAPLGLRPARLSMNVAPRPGPRPSFSPIAQVSANQAEPAGCSTNGAVSRARAGCHSSDWFDKA